MCSLSIEERSALVEAASAFLATTERMELMRDQAVSQLGGRPGFVPMSAEKVEALLAPAKALMRGLAEVLGKHKDISAVRFRGHIFALNLQKVRMPAAGSDPELELTIVRESGIASLD